MEPSTEPSRLLKLPAELRLAIFEYALADNSETVAVGLPSAMPWHGKPHRYHPPLVEVCSTIRREALPIFYRTRSVALLLRFREGRDQTQHWIRNVYSDPEICKNVEKVRIQYFEECHRFTSLNLNMHTLVLLNKDSWVHPLTKRPLRLLGSIEEALSYAKDLSYPSAADKAIVLQKVIDAMTSPLQISRLMQRESIANLRLHGYTDFELRSEVLSIISYS